MPLVGVCFWRFESSVILEGSKTELLCFTQRIQFESSVILEGSKTQGYSLLLSEWFESSVILEGSKTLSEPNEPKS